MAFNPIQFMSQVRAEAVKVVWPTRGETVTTTIIVFIMATLVAIFFFVIDKLITLGLEGLLNIAS